MNSCGEMERHKIRTSRQFSAATYITYKTYISKMSVEMRLFPVLDFTIFEWHAH